MNNILHIKRASHYFTAYTENDQILALLISFSKLYTQVDNSRPGYASITPYVAIIRANKEVRYHVNSLGEFLKYIDQNKYRVSTPIEIKVEQIPINPGKDIVLKMKPGKEPRDYQIPIIEYVLNQKSQNGIHTGENIKQTFIGIQTGEGKTFVSGYCASKLSKRVLICVRAGFLDKWSNDILDLFDIKPKEAVLVKGKKALLSLLNMVKDSEYDQIKIILVSSSTLRTWFKDYEVTGKEIFLRYNPITPDQLYEHLGVGLRIIDEVHIEFHAHFIHDLYTNVEKSISLSATLINNNNFVASMYELAYPKVDRYKSPALKKYTKTYPVIYSLASNRKVATSEYGTSSYSHTAFEKSILGKKNKELKRNYFNLILQVLKHGYIKKYEKGNKALVYASTKEMCLQISIFLKQYLPHLDIRRYVDEDPYVNLMEPDIVVSTPTSAGTGHDIKGLTDVIMTTCVQSPSLNIQSYGRLREIPNKETRFYYFACFNIEKQFQYHLEKMELLRDRTTSIEILNFPLIL